MAQISIWCSKELQKLIKKRAEAKDLSVSSFCRMKIVESLQDRLP